MRELSSSINNKHHLLFFILIAILALRWVAVIFSPLELVVDEAQYWLWSKTLDFGYYSKPPLISWLISISQSIFGDEAWAARLFAAPFNVATSYILFLSGKKLFNESAGIWAAVFWVFLPATSLGSFIISTDTPLIFFWSLGLLIIAKCKESQSFRKKLCLFFFSGMILGFGMLSKYAAIYFPLSIVIWFLWEEKINYKKNIQLICIFFLGFLIITSPNIIWLIDNHFVSLIHLTHNANLEDPTYKLSSVFFFWASQIGVLGPILFFLVLNVFLIDIPHKKFLLSFSIPVLVIISFQAFAKEANANWAIVGYPSLIILTAGYLSQSGKVLTRLGKSAVTINVSISIALILVALTGTFGPFEPKSDPLRKLRGWGLLAEDIEKLGSETGAKTVVADSRETAAMLSYKMKDSLINVKIFDKNGHPDNHYELERPFNQYSALPAIALSKTLDKNLPDFIIWEGPISLSSHSISKLKSRRIYMFLGRKITDHQ